MQIVRWKQGRLLPGVLLFGVVGVLGGILLSVVPVRAWGFPTAQMSGLPQTLPGPDVPELGYCELVNADEWVSATQTRQVQLQRCLGPDNEWMRMNPGKRVSAADLVPVAAPPAAFPATSEEAPNTTQ